MREYRLAADDELDDYEEGADIGVDDDLGDALAAHLELLSAKQRVDEVGEHGHRHDEPECVRSRHQTRSSTRRSR